ncbi:RHS repeat-associated core domain-containing protein, partial [Pseudomonas plecoglossicida]
VKDNRIQQWRDQEYRYDPWGNLIEKRSGHSRLQNFSYDCENRLVRAETLVNGKLESTGEYRYDSLGRRVAKHAEINGEVEQKRFLWQGLRMLREETPGQSIVYLYEPGSYAPLARIDQEEGEEKKVYYFHTDQIGTPLELTDSQGEIVWQATYRSWGSIEHLAVNEIEQNLRLQGQYLDSESRLHYNTFRYYDPEVGRFTTQDPIGIEGGFNLYRYVPNPTGWVDPWGWACNKPGGYKAGDVDVHGNLSPQVNRAIGNKNIAADDFVQSHHFIQHEWAKLNVKGYKRNSAPAILLKSSSGEPHAMISAMQRSRRSASGFGGTLRDEFNVAYKEMIDAGVSPGAAKRAASRSYKYYEALGAFN